jgi:hypothetical protein
VDDDDAAPVDEDGDGVRITGSMSQR